MVEKLQVLGKTGRSSLQKSTTFNVSGKRPSQLQRLNYSPSVPGPVAVDPYFSNNVLLIHADNITGANNTVFLDSSGSTYVPFYGTYSNYFNGSTDYLTAPNNTLFQIDAAFTAECWIYPNDVLAASNYGFIGYHAINTGTGTSGGWILNLSGSTNGMLVFNTYNNNSAASTSQLTSAANALTANQWNHIAVSYDGTTYRLFINGSIVDSSASIGAISYGGAVFNIGRWNYSSPRYFNGYISNVRFVKGTALYTSQFIPSTTPLTAVTNTALLTCQSLRFIDNSTNNFTITTTGTPAISSGGAAVKIGAGKPIQGRFSPFSDIGWSNLFNGSTGYLQFPRAAGLITTGPFTVEAWVNIAAHKTDNHIIGDRYWSTGQNGGWGVYVNSSGNVVFTASEQVFNTFPNVLTSSSTLSVNTWYHIAVVRDNRNFLNMYINGVLAATPVLYNFDLSRNTGGTQTNWLTNIGINNADGTNFNFINGYVSNARIVMGTAVYNGNFTPSKVPLEAIPGTTLLTCKENVLRDSSYNYPITLGGTPVALKSSPFYALTNDGSSIYFNGTSDFLTIPTGTFVFGSSDFTVEAWVYTTAYNTSAAGGEVIIDNWIGANPNYVTGQWQLWLSTTGVVEFQYATSATTTVKATSTATVPLNAWCHIAAVRSGSTITVYLNGVSVATSAVSISIGAAGTSGIAKQSSGGTYYYTGYISNIKVLKGKALYTTTFTPPTSPATAADAPVLLLNQTNASIVDQTGRNNLTTYGSAAISSTQSKFGGTSMYFDGSTGYLTAPYLANTTPLTPTLLIGDFTIEAWIYITSSASGAFIATFGSEAATRFEVGYNTSRQLIYDIYGVGTTTFTGGSFSLNTWTHVSYVRSGSTITGYINGVNVGSGTSSATFGNATGGITIGRDNSTGYVNGYVDDLRISKYARVPNNNTLSVTALLVAGGGGGGGNIGGGGGAGGFILSNYSIDPNVTHVITVGAGGAGGAGNNNGNNGSDTSLISNNSSFSNTVIGGGGGGNFGQGSSVAGNNGGSGGGAPGTGSGQGKAAGTGTAGQGNNGGAGVAQDGNGAGGGGGGSANTGGAASSRVGGEGGQGIPSTISGSTVYYSGGGGGASNTLGGVSPTANGGATAAGNTTVAAALNNSGGGGGGAAGLGVLAVSGTGGNGGSGIAIIAYDGNQIFTGGTVTTVNSRTVHTFTTSANLTPITVNQSSYVPTSAFPDQ